MKTQIIIVGFLLVLSACASPEPTAIPSSTSPPVSTPSATHTALPTSTPTLVPTSAAASCRLFSRAERTEIHFGFPRPEVAIPTVGDSNAIVLFAEFDDVEANQEPEEVFAIISPEAETFYSSISYGKMNLQLTPHFEWLRMSKPSREYEFSSYEGHFEYIREAMKLADEVVDFSKYDQVIVLTNPRATAFPAGPSFNANSDFWGITMDGKTILNATTSGYDLNNWGFLWLNHELGHNMGLPDLYLYNSGNQFRDVGTYSIMGNIGGRAPEFFAWERWLLGWLEDDQINCLSNSETFSLSPIELADGLVKSTVIKISNKQAIILESRRAIGYDAGLGNEGVLIYLVDPSIDSGEGALVIFPNDSLNASGRTALLGAGENYTILDMTFTVLESNDKEDIVEVIFAE